MRERKDKYPERRCSICKSTRGFIRSYGLNLCRRCFKDNALKLGFKKFD